MLTEPAPNNLSPVQTIQDGGGEILERLMQRALDAGRASTIRPNPVRPLFWGLLCFTILMLFVAWAGLGELIIPPTPGTGVRLVDMPAPLLALNVALCFLPVAAFVLILLGVSRMMWFIPAVGSKLVWRIGDHYVSAVMIAALILIGYFALFGVLLTIAFLEFAGGGINPVVGLAGAVTAAEIPVALGWYLMLLSGWCLSRIARKTERTLLFLAVSWAGAFAVLLIIASTIATLAIGSAAFEPNAVIPSRVPWADAASGVAGFAALVVLTVIARRVSARYEPEGLVAGVQPA